MLQNRRIYISSIDNKTPDVKWSTIEIDLSGGRIGRKSGEQLTLALVRASFPATTSALPVTSVISEDITQNISVLAFAYSADGTTFGDKKRIYYNQTSSTLNSGANNSNGYWCLNTTIDQILSQINLINGAGDLKLDSLGRLTMGAGTGAVEFFVDDTSLKIMNAFGLKRNLPPGSGESPIITNAANFPDRSPVSLASVLPAIYITINNNMDSFASARGGSSVNILASVPVDVSNTSVGNDVIVSVVGGEKQMSNPSSQLNYTNHDVGNSHKSIDDHNIGRMTFNLVNDELKPIGTMGQEFNLCIDFKTINAPN